MTRTRRNAKPRYRSTVKTKRTGIYRNGTAEPVWVDLPDEELLDWPLGDLGVRIAGSTLEPRIEKLYAELAERGLRFRPHCWLAEEWFSPEGIPGIAIPFYLAHPRLMRLEKRQMLEVEGGTKEWCMKILRHEAGHCIDTAFRLNRRRRWRELFGRSAARYPEYYQPKPYSKNYVLHLDHWYAQSHPLEDFAETFAVWLKPRSRWRAQYQGWPALRKLEYVEELMDELAGQTALVRTRQSYESLRTVRKTLREHYEEKRQRYGVDAPGYYDQELRRLFSDAPTHAKRPSAAAFLRRIRPELRRIVARWTGQYQYTIDQVLNDMIVRCRELNLRLERSQTETRREALVMLTVQTMNHLHGGHHRIAI